MPAQPDSNDYSMLTKKVLAYKHITNLNHIFFKFQNNPIT